MLKITLNIDGMMCSHCEAHMSDAIRNSFAVNDVTSSHSKKRTVIITENDISDEELSKVVLKAGYKLLGISRQPYEKKRLFSILKK